jgi:hypothetical protein
MANEVIGGWLFYLYIIWLDPEEAFLKFYFFKKKLLKNDIFLMKITVDELGVKSNLCR